MNLEILERTTSELVGAKSLEDLLKTDKKLRIKYGVDVTAPFMHTGHAVNLWYMRELQEAGHKVVFLIGDFTTRIGDPTGKSQTRPVIPQEEIEKNADEFIKQISKIILTDPEVFEVRRNSEWYDKMPMQQMFNLLSMVTHSQLISRDMFQKRIKEGREIHMHEMLYPILQGYDSYMLESDLTIVGSDQLFNEMMGRTYQNKFGQNEQVVITTRITPGTDGKEKQSKSIGNYIAITDTSRDQFGKVMSLPDELIACYLETYTTMPQDEIEEIKQRMIAGENPMISKKKLACALVSRYYGDDVAQQELKWFEDVFSNKKAPQDAAEISMGSEQATLLEIVKKAMPDSSNRQIKELIESGAVRIGGEKVQDREATIRIHGTQPLQIGKKRFFSLTA